MSQVLFSTLQRRKLRHSIEMVDPIIPILIFKNVYVDECFVYMCVCASCVYKAPPLIQFLMLWRPCNYFVASNYSFEICCCHEL